MRRFAALFLAAVLVPAWCSGCVKPEPNIESASRIEPVEIGTVKYFFMTESGGMDPRDRTAYELNCEDSPCSAYLKPPGIEDEEALTVDADAEFRQNLENVLRENHVGDWNGYDESEDVLDGIGFTLKVIMDDDTEVNAKGYMQWPNGYNHASSAIYNLFLELYEENGGKPLG